MPLSFEERAAIGGNVLLPALQGAQEQLRMAGIININNDDLIFATLWALVRLSVETNGTGAIENLRDVIDVIEQAGPFGIGD